MSRARSTKADQTGRSRLEVKKSVVVYWLTPAKPQRELFCELIRILAERFQAPVFEPHLTLCLGQDRQSRNNRSSRSLSESPQKVLRRVVAAPVRLWVREIAYSSRFTKTLFVRFKPERAFGDLAVALGSTAVSDPHLSLIYKGMPARIKNELAATIKLPFRTVTFDAIKAVRCTSPTTTVAEVESWRAVARRRLLG